MAQRKKTEAYEVDADALPELTHKQLKFVMCILEGMTASDAYRAAYDAENMSNESIWVEASKTKHSPNVSLWIDAGKIAGMQKAGCTREQHLRRLEELSTKAEKSGNYGAAVQAEQLRGKVEGYYVERTEDLTDRDKPSVFERMKELRKGDGKDAVH